MCQHLSSAPLTDETKNTDVISCRLHLFPYNHLLSPYTISYLLYNHPLSSYTISCLLPTTTCHPPTQSHVSTNNHLLSFYTISCLSPTTTCYPLTQSPVSTDNHLLSFYTISCLSHTTTCYPPTQSPVSLQSPAILLHNLLSLPYNHLLSSYTITCLPYNHLLSFYTISCLSLTTTCYPPIQSCIICHLPIPLIPFFCDNPLLYFNSQVSDDNRQSNS